MMLRIFELTKNYYAYLSFEVKKKNSDHVLYKEKKCGNPSTYLKFLLLLTYGLGYQGRLLLAIHIFLQLFNVGGQCV